MTREYFVMAIDYGRDGLEAIVHPEDTRRATVERVREAIGDNSVIAFIHHIHDGVQEDVTNSILKDAGFFDREIEPEEIDRAVAKRDHGRELRKTFEPAWP